MCVCVCKFFWPFVEQLHYLRLPKDIKDRHVMLMDATMATGAAAMMAIRVLLDHDVPEENIYLLSLIMAVSGMSMCIGQISVQLLTTLNMLLKVFLSSTKLRLHALKRMKAFIDILLMIFFVSRPRLAVTSESTLLKLYCRMPV